MDAIHNLTEFDGREQTPILKEIAKHKKECLIITIFKILSLLGFIASSFINLILAGVFFILFIVLIVINNNKKKILHYLNEKLKLAKNNDMVRHNEKVRFMENQTLIKNKESRDA